jgi:hypothetical protein
MNTKRTRMGLMRRISTLLTVTVLATVGIGISPRGLADSASINFENPPYVTGSINGQDGWSSTGSAGSGCAMYDHAVVTNGPLAPPTFGNQSLRISNAVTSGCFGDQTFSKSLINEAGETTATNNGLSGGVREAHFESQWDFASTVPAAEQVGLSVVVSPDRGDGSRMSWVQMTDTPAGLQVNFFDVQGTSNPANFVGPTTVASGLARNIPHTIKVTIDFIAGPSNDVVKVYVDGVLVHTGTTWENYYRYDTEAQPEGGPRTVDSVLFRTGGTAFPANAGKGFLIDNLSLSSGPTPIGPPTDKDQCKNGGWKSFNNPSFKNQGQCVSFTNHQ